MSHLFLLLWLNLLQSLWAFQKASLLKPSDFFCMWFSIIFSFRSFWGKKRIISPLVLFGNFKMIYFRMDSFFITGAGHLVNPLHIWSLCHVVLGSFHAAFRLLFLTYYVHPSAFLEVLLSVQLPGLSPSFCMSSLLFSNACLFCSFQDISLTLSPNSFTDSFFHFSYYIINI